MEQTIEQRIGNFFRERREVKQDRESVLQVLRNAGYKNRMDTSLSEEDVNFFGRQKEYPVRYEFGTPFIDECSPNYALVPVHFVDTFSNNESEELVLVDRAKKKKMTIANAGLRGVHYEGRCKLVPLALSVKDGKAIISYNHVLHADFKNPVKVSEGVFANYLFRHSENCVAEVDLNEMEKKQ